MFLRCRLERSVSLSSASSESHAPLLIVTDEVSFRVISFDELLPGTEKYGHHHLGIIGVVTGMAVMAVSLLLMS